MVSRTEQLLADFARMRELMNRRYSLDDIASTATAGIVAARDYELLKAEVRAELNEITGLLADIRRSMLVASSPQT